MNNLLKLAHDETYVSLKKLHDMAEKKIVNSLALNLMGYVYIENMVKPLLNIERRSKKQRKEYINALWEYREILYHKATISDLLTTKKEVEVK